jgi:hypothetical protein
VTHPRALGLADIKLEIIPRRPQLCTFRWCSSSSASSFASSRLATSGAKTFHGRTGPLLSPGDRSRSCAAGHLKAEVSTSANSPVVPVFFANVVSCGLSVVGSGLIDEAPGAEQSYTWAKYRKAVGTDEILANYATNRGFNAEQSSHGACRTKGKPPKCSIKAIPGEPTNDCTSASHAERTA